MAEKTTNELLDIFESLLRAQLNAIRQLRKAAGEEPKPPKEKSMSKIDAVYNILGAAQQPLHVDVIIAQAKIQYQMHLDKESIVSALTKRVKRKDRFTKTAPNTFSLLSVITKKGE